MQPFTGKLLHSTLLWCCLFLNFPQFAILKKIVNFILGTVRSESVQTNSQRIDTPIYELTFDNLPSSIKVSSKFEHFFI